MLDVSHQTFLEVGSVGFPSLIGTELLSRAVSLVVDLLTYPADESWDKDRRGWSRLRTAVKVKGEKEKKGEAKLSQNKTFDLKDWENILRQSGITATPPSISWQIPLD